jgi:hypothetical protein
MDEERMRSAQPPLALLADLAPSTARQKLGLLKSSLSSHLLENKLKALPPQSFFSPPCNEEVRAYNRSIIAQRIEMMPDESGQGSLLRERRPWLCRPLVKAKKDAA